MHTFSRRQFLLGAGTVLGTLAISGTPAQATQALTAYFSWSGNTRGIARLIQQKIGGELFEIEPVTPYSGEYDTCLEQARRDQQRQARPELKTSLANMARYDVVLLGYPHWWGTFPMPVASFLEQYDFSGKNIVPFVSHGGSGLGHSVADIKKLCPKANVLDAFAVRGRGGPSLAGDIDAWLGRIGIRA